MATTPEIKKVLTDEELKFTLAADAAGGTLVDGGYKIGVFENLQGGKAGDDVVLRVKGYAKVPKSSATVFAAGAAVNFNFTTRLAVTSGGTAVGLAVYAAPSGQDFVWVDLNAS